MYHCNDTVVTYEPSPNFLLDLIAYKNNGKSKEEILDNLEKYAMKVVSKIQKISQFLWMKTYLLENRGIVEKVSEAELKDRLARFGSKEQLFAYLRSRIGDYVAA